METTEDLQTNAVLQSSEIERCKPSISDQGVDVPLDTWAITCVEEHLARLSEGSFAQALSPQRTKGLDHTDTFGEGGADEFACRLLSPDDLLEAPFGKRSDSVRRVDDDRTTEYFGVRLDQRSDLPLGDREEDQVCLLDSSVDAGSDLHG